MFGRRTSALGLLTLMLAIGPQASCLGEEFSAGSPLAKRLRASITSIVDGKSFRDGLTRIAQQAELNLWIDRRVDPTSPITLGPVGPTVFQALEKIAAERDCVVMPMSNVVLIGRPTWVDQVATTLATQGVQTKPGLAANVPTVRPQQISWSRLSTPLEALRAATGDERTTVNPPLPHDLWPATSWTDVTAPVATELVLAQFHRRSKFATDRRVVTSVPSNPSAYTLKYSVDLPPTQVRQIMRSVDPASQIIPSRDGPFRATGNAAAHREAIAFVLRQPPKAPPPGAAAGKATFSLTATARAGELLISLAKSANRQCVIENEAREACGKVVSIKATDLTLRELIQRVADSAGVVAVWQPNVVEIRPAK